MFKASTNLKWPRCGSAYWSLIQTDEPLEMHLSHNDMLAMTRIYRLFIQETTA
jgi:hypothetical protein